ncbi:MAG: tyrosinase family protein [Chloroflexi bacterium]|nr:tyrosinase family protein [Chloroflexota bacterium]
MRTELAINGSTDAAANFIGWAPVPSQLRLADASGATSPVTVKLRNKNTTAGGQVQFFTALPGAPQAELQLTLPSTGTPIQLFVGGQFGKPSSENGDAAIEIVDASGTQILSTTPLMVRVRKNANALTVNERNRFRAAFATLNNRGQGKFSDFRNIHTNAGSPEAHGNPGFLPWHRSFMLDLERELQRIDSTVALPYWRFDQPAPNLFTLDFMGVSDANGTVRFSPTNPLQFWSTDGSVGIVRSPHFNTKTQPAHGQLAVMTEAATFALSGPNKSYEPFRQLEGNPHGAAHVSFGGSLSSIPTAAKDPLFFLLHANVDRLWAKWQWFNHRFDLTSTTSFTFLGKAGDPGSFRIGHNLQDTMWPWNQITGGVRPPTAPGGNFPPSVLSNAPGLTPAVRHMIDYQGVLTPASRLGFDYDDVPFEAH